MMDVKKGVYLFIFVMLLGDVSLYDKSCMMIFWMYFKIMGIWWNIIR